MGEMDLGSATTTNYSSVVKPTTIDWISLDQANTGPDGETYWYFKNAQKDIGVYTTRPEVYSAINAFAVWAFGKGFITDTISKVVLEHLSGWGEDTAQTIFQNIFIMKKAVGDGFAQIITKDNKPFKSPKEILNLVPISPERVRLVLNPKGRIKRYDVMVKREWKPIVKEMMFHSANNRIADQIHGTSALDAVRWIIEAKKEALEDERMIRHRDKALGIAYYDTDDTGKIAYANAQIEKAVNKGEMLGLPKGTVEIVQFPNKTSAERQQWLQILDGLFYQNIGVPRVIATSEGQGEAGSKMGYMIFDPSYSNEQTIMEADIWNQLGIRIKFNRPPSLTGVMAENEQKNTGQTSIQPNEVTATAGRTE